MQLAEGIQPSQSAQLKHEMRTQNERASRGDRVPLLPHHQKKKKGRKQSLCIIMCSVQTANALFLYTSPSPRSPVPSSSARAGKVLESADSELGSGKELLRDGL